MQHYSTRYPFSRKKSDLEVRAELLGWISTALFFTCFLGLFGLIGTWDLESHGIYRLTTVEYILWALGFISLGIGGFSLRVYTLVLIDRKKDKK